SLSPVLNVASIKVINSITKDINYDTKFLVKSYIIGYLTAIVWSPYFASTAIVLFLLNIKFSEFILLGLFSSALQLVIGFLLFSYFQMKNSNNDNCNQYTESEVERNKIKNFYKTVIKLLLIILALIAFLILLEYFTNASMILLVTISSLILPIIWGGVNGNIRKVFSGFAYNLSNLVNSSSIIVLFLGAGVLGSVLEDSPFSELFTS